MKIPPSDNGQDTAAALGKILALVGEFVDSGAALEPDIAAAIGAAAFDSSDSYALDVLETRLEPYLTITKLFPQPWGPNPAHGEVDGPYRIAHVDGQPDNPFGLTAEELNLNVLVCGEQGFGKTTFLKALVASLMEQCDE